MQLVPCVVYVCVRSCTAAWLCAKGSRGAQRTIMPASYSLFPAAEPSTVSPSTTTGVPVQTTVPHTPTSVTEEPTSGDDMSVHCRNPCSVSFCSEDGMNRKKRICSAAGYVASNVWDRVGESFGTVCVCMVLQCAYLKHCGKILQLRRLFCAVNCAFCIS